ETRAGVEHEVADARTQMVEERPAQADEDDIARDRGGHRSEGLISLGPAGQRSQPPQQHRKPYEGEAVATDAVKDRHQHVRSPPPVKSRAIEEMRRKWAFGHGLSRLRKGALPLADAAGEASAPPWS